MFESIARWFLENWPRLLTTIWLCLIAGYILNFGGPFWSLSLNELGDFFAGAVGPLALLWLVRGYAQQNAAITIQSDELRTAVEQHKAQVEATRVLADNDARHARIDYYKILSECSKAIGNCNLLLRGDAETKSASTAKYTENPNLSNLNAHMDRIRKQQDEVAKQISRSLSMARLLPTKTKEARSAREVLIGELDELSLQQEGFQDRLDEISNISFTELEIAFRRLVVHSVDIHNLIARSELYLAIEEKGQQAEAELSRSDVDKE